MGEKRRRKHFRQPILHCLKEEGQPMPWQIVARDDPKRGRHGGSSSAAKRNSPLSAQISQKSEDEREKEREKPGGFRRDCVRIA